MSHSIPVQNLYYLLSYAWEEKLSAGELESIDSSSCPNLESFFAEVLTRRLAPLIHRGLDRAYIKHEELTSQPKGRIDFSASAKRQTWLQGRMHCSYDNLSRDVLHNRIIKCTLKLLYYQCRIEGKLQKKLHDQLDYFSEVQDIRVTGRSFQRIQLHRNNKAYRFILQLCELVHSSLLPEHDTQGRRKFRRIEEDAKVMPYVFENFILNFAKRNILSARSHRPVFKWIADYHSPQTEAVMPKMMTDVTIEWKTGRKLILDCKYYKQAFSVRSYGENKEVERLKTNNLYQVFSYLMNARQHKDGWEEVEGMLLYPTTTDDFHHDMTLSGQHRMQVCSINLNQDWRGIEEQLMHLLTNIKAL